MSRSVVAVLSGTALVIGGAVALWPRGSAEPEATAQARAPAAALPAAETLRHGELLAPGPVLEPSARATSLNGKRVRMVGFMAQMEMPPRGAFYLVPRPLHVDEAGGGTADLPPQSVLVVSRSVAGQAVPFIPGALEVSGVLEIGNRADEHGHVSAIRLILDSEPLSNPRGEP